MRSDQRQFQIFDLEIAARKDDPVLPNMKQVADVWRKMFAARKTYDINGGDGTMIIGDFHMAPQADHVTLLVRLSDKRAPNSVYSNMVSDDFTEHVKEDDTGADFGCHVLISTVQENGVPNVYTCIIERVSGLPSGMVRRLLSKMLYYEYKEDDLSFRYQSPAGGLDREGNPRTERCCPHIELRGRPSDAFIDEIDNGRLTGVTLVRAEPVTPLTGASYLRMERSELRLTIDRANIPQKAWSSLKNALWSNAKTYGTAMVSYRLPGTSRVVTVEIDSATGSPVSDLYIKTFELNNIFPPLAQSARKIVPHLVGLAVPEFLSNRTV